MVNIRVTIDCVFTTMKVQCEDEKCDVHHRPTLLSYIHLVVIGEGVV